MAQTASGLAAVLKERWTDDQLQKQFLSDDTPLAAVEKFKATMIGKQAQVPVWTTGASAGYTTVGAGGGNINAAGQQGVNQALYTLVTAAGAGRAQNQTAAAWACSNRSKTAAACSSRDE